MRAGDGVSYGHTWIADRDTTLALLPIGYADGVFRTLSGRIDVLINGRLRRSVGRICMDQFVVDLGAGRSMSSEGDRDLCSGPAPTVSPPRRIGPNCSAPSTTRWSPARGGRVHRGLYRGRPKPLSDRRTRAAGWRARRDCDRGRHSPPRVSGRQVAAPTRRFSDFDPYEAEDFELLDADPQRMSSPRRRRSPCGPRGADPNAPLTVVFAHGFCLRMGAFYFQRARLTEQWGSTRCGWCSTTSVGTASPGSASRLPSRVAQLGQDLEAVLAVMAPRGPVVLVGHSMGGMTVLSHARQFPQRYHTRIVGAALISSAAEGVSRSPLGEILKQPRAGGGALRRPVRAQDRAPHPRRRQVGDRADPACGLLR